MTLQADVWQGKYGEDLVRAIASAAGLTTAKRDIDVDGVDLNIGYPGKIRGIGFPCIEVQIKSWRSPVVRDNAFSYPLKIRNYNLLVGAPGVDFPVPRLLFLTITPPVAEDYVHCCEAHYEFHHLVYWASLMHLPPERNAHDSKTVKIPLANVVAPSTLVGLLGRRFDEEAA